MSVDATRWAWSQRGLSPSQKLVLLSMADRAGEQHECWPSIKRLCFDTGLYRETVMAAIVLLEERGLIRATRAQGRVSCYRLLGVQDRATVADQSAKADQSGKADQSAKAARTSRQKPTPTSRQKPTLNLSREPTKEPTKKPPGKQGRFVRPTLAQVKAYCEQRDNGIDPEQWIDHYTANGWRVGKNPMRDWQAAVRTWERKRGLQPIGAKPHERPDKFHPATAIRRAIRESEARESATTARVMGGAAPVADADGIRPQVREPLSR